MRWRALMMVLVASRALAGAPCTLSGTGRDAPDGAIIVAGVRLGRTAPFKHHHRLAVTLTAPRWGVRVENENLRLEFELENAAPLEVQLTRSVQFGLFTGHPGLTVQVLGPASDQLQLGVADPPRLRPVSALRAVAPCRVASLTPIAVSGSQLEEPPGPRVLIAQGEVPISAQPGGAPVGTLRVGPDDVGTMLELRGESARLWWDGADGVIEGWVPSRALSIITVNWGSGEGGLHGKQDHLIRVKHADTRTCAVDVPLFALRDGVRSRLGVIKRGAPLEALRSDAHDVVVKLELDGVQLDPGFELAISAKEWDSCR